MIAHYPERIFPNGILGAPTVDLSSRIEYLAYYLGLPLYLGPSRKSFLGAITGATVHDRLGATAAAVAAAVFAGAAFVRVHDVRVMRQVLDVAASIRDSAGEAVC